jgi:hypothetical protein
MLVESVRRGTGGTFPRGTLLPDATQPLVKLRENELSIAKPRAILVQCLEQIFHGFGRQLKAHGGECDEKLLLTHLSVVVVVPALEELTRVRTLALGRFEVDPI